MYNPLYLRDVVRQHLWLKGPGDPPPPPPLAEQLVRQLARRPSLARQLTEWMRSPWERAGQRWNIVGSYDPGEIEATIDYQIELDDPFSAASLEHEAFRNELRAGGTLVFSDPETGEIVGARELAKRPGPGGAPNN